MNVGDLIKHRKREWYAIVIGFRTELRVGGISEKLPEDNKNYPIFVWVKLDGHVPGQKGEVDSCYHSHMEVVQSPYRSTRWFPIDSLVS
jgi:hypothetical protein